MVFLLHLIYAVIFAVYFAAVITTYPETKEDIRESSSVKQLYLNLIPFIFMGLIYLFPLIDSCVQTDSMEGFINRFTLEFITASFANAIIFFNCTNFATKKAEKLKWLPYVGFIIYTLIKNINTHDNIFMIILAEVWGIVVLVAFAFFAYMLKDTFTVPTRAEKAEEDAKMEARAKRWQEENRKQREYEAWKAQFRPASTNNSSNSNNSYSSTEEKKGFFSSLSDAASEYYNEKGDTSEAKYGKCCQNCRHYDGDTCDCQYSSSYGKSIWSPSSTSCGYHNY